MAAFGKEELCQSEDAVEEKNAIGVLKETVIMSVLALGNIALWISLFLSLSPSPSPLPFPSPSPSLYTLILRPGSWET